MIPIDIGTRIFRPWNGTSHKLPPGRLANSPISRSIGCVDPFDMTNPVGDAAEPRETLPFDGMLEIAASRIVRAPQPYPSAGEQLRGIPPGLGVEFAFRRLIQ